MLNCNYQYYNLKEKPQIKEKASEWFFSKWKVSTEAHLECMNAYLWGATDHGWYLCLDGDKII